MRFWPGVVLPGASLDLLRTVTLLRVVRIGVLFGQTKVSGLIMRQRYSPPLV